MAANNYRDELIKILNTDDYVDIYNVVISFGDIPNFNNYTEVLKYLDTIEETGFVDKTHIIEIKKKVNNLSLVEYKRMHPKKLASKSQETFAQTKPQPKQDKIIPISIKEQVIDYLTDSGANIYDDIFHKDFESWTDFIEYINKSQYTLKEKQLLLNFANSHMQKQDKTMPPTVAYQLINGTTSQYNLGSPSACVITSQAFLQSIIKKNFITYNSDTVDNITKESTSYKCDTHLEISNIPGYIYGGQCSSIAESIDRIIELYHGVTLKLKAIGFLFETRQKAIGIYIDNNKVIIYDSHGLDDAAPKVSFIMVSIINKKQTLKDILTSLLSIIYPTFEKEEKDDYQKQQFTNVDLAYVSISPLPNYSYQQKYHKYITKINNIN